MVRAAWKTKKVVESKKEVNKTKDKPEKIDVSDEEKPKPPKPQAEQKTPKTQYNQIYGR